MSHVQNHDELSLSRSNQLAQGFLKSRLASRAVDLPEDFRPKRPDIELPGLSAVLSVVSVLIFLFCLFLLPVILPNAVTSDSLFGLLDEVPGLVAVLAMRSSRK
jgi:hypothetical protein